MKAPKQMPVFPLPIFLLPGGRTRLRIFEPRYVRMVKETVGANGFVLSYLQKEKEFASSDWGAWVSIIDFETLPDGMLGITVEAKQLVYLKDFYYQEDRLLNATVTPKPHWQQSQVSEDAEFEQIKRTYNELLEQQAQLAELYPEPKLDEPQWLVARWLEVLPLNSEIRHKLTQSDSFEFAIDTIETIILGK